MGRSPTFLLLCLIFIPLSVSACSEGSEAPVSTGDVEIIGEIHVPDSDTGKGRDDTEGGETSKPRLVGTVIPFGPPQGGPTINLFGGGMKFPHQHFLVDVYAQDLGKIAGLSFYIEFDPEMMVFVEGTSGLDLDGGEVGMSTRHVVKEIEPGLITYGVAKFCDSKAPGAGIDQCGGGDVNYSQFVMRLEFELRKEGETFIRFLPDKALIRRPDRSIVSADYIGGSLNLFYQEGR